MRSDKQSEPSIYKSCPTFHLRSRLHSSSRFFQQNRFVHQLHWPKATHSLPETNRRKWPIQSEAKIDSQVGQIQSRKNTYLTHDIEMIRSPWKQHGCLATIRDPWTSRVAFWELILLRAHSPELFPLHTIPQTVILLSWSWNTSFGLQVSCHRFRDRRWREASSSGDWESWRKKTHERRVSRQRSPSRSLTNQRKETRLISPQLHWDFQQRCCLWILLQRRTPKRRMWDILGHSELLWKMQERESYHLHRMFKSKSLQMKSWK